MSITFVVVPVADSSYTVIDGEPDAELTKMPSMDLGAEAILPDAETKA